MYDSPRLQFDGHKDVPRPEEQVVRDDEVAGLTITGVILQESGPGLARRTTQFGPILLNRPLADPNSELQQFAADSLGTPQPVFLDYLPDEGDCLRGDTRLSLLIVWGPIDNMSAFWLLA
jgi:hypothetical protein